MAEEMEIKTETLAESTPEKPEKKKREKQQKKPKPAWNDPVERVRCARSFHRLLLYFRILFYLLPAYYPSRQESGVGPEMGQDRADLRVSPDG